MEKPAADRIEQQVRSAFPDGTITSVRVLEYGDDPSVEPSETAVRVVIKPAGRSEGTDADEAALQAFEQANRAAIRKLPDELPRHVRWVEFAPNRSSGTAKSHGPVLKIRGRRGRGAAADDVAEEL